HCSVNTPRSQALCLGNEGEGLRTVSLKLRCNTLLSLSLLCLLAWPQTGFASIQTHYRLGELLPMATHILVMRVEKVDREKNIITYKKVEDLKGKHPTDTIQHEIGKNGFHPREWQYTMKWAEVGKTAVMFHNGGGSVTCIGDYWYQSYPEKE